MTEKENALTDAEAALLERYLDNESGVLGRMRARWLLGRNVAAKDYIDTLSAARSAAEEYASFMPVPSEDLWKRVSRRIEQQERLDAISTDDSEGFWTPILDGLGRVSWGAAGGLAAAGLVLAFSHFNMQVPSTLNGSSHLSSNGIGGSTEPVQLASGVFGAPRHDRQYLYENGRGEGGNTPSFDRLRSSGRVRVMRRPSEGSTIFWVERKDEQLLGEKNRIGASFLDQRAANDPMMQGD